MLQVRELERSVAETLEGPSHVEKSPAVQQIEISAREEERARWKVSLAHIVLHHPPCASDP